MIRRVGFGSALMAACTWAAAVPVTSSTSEYTTFRDCIAGTTVCDNITPVQVGNYGGAPGDTSASATQTDANYGQATGSALLGATAGSASLVGSAYSVAGERVSTNSYSLQQFTYGGATPMTLVFSGLLNYNQTVPTANAAFDPNNSSAVFSGAGAYLEVFTLADAFIDAGTSDEDNWSVLNSGYQLAPGYVSLGTSDNGILSNVTGSGSTLLSVSFTIDPGQSVWLLSALQTPAVNGADVVASLDSSLAAAVPEPGTLLLVGTSLIGVLGLRRRVVRSAA